MPPKILLLDEKWDKKMPYSLFRINEAEEGVVGVGIAQKLYAIHVAITHIVNKIFTGIRRVCVPRVYVQAGAKPSASDISSVPGEIIEVNDLKTNKPIFETPPPTNPMAIDFLERLWQKGFDVIGISQLSAAGRVPAGLERASGIAIRSYQQIETERFQLMRADYEEMFIELAVKSIKLSSDSMLPKGLSRKQIEDAKDDLTIWNSSLLPETPAGRLATVSDLLNSQLINPQQALTLIESPDTERFLSSENSRSKAIEMLIEKALDEKRTPTIYPELGLELYLDKVQKSFSMLLLEEGEGSNKLALLSPLIKELEEKINEQTRTASALQAVAQGGQTPGPQQPLEGMQAMAGEYV